MDEMLFLFCLESFSSFVFFASVKKEIGNLAVLRVQLLSRVHSAAA